MAIEFKVLKEIADEIKAINEEELEDKIVIVEEEEKDKDERYFDINQWGNNYGIIKEWRKHINIIWF